MISSMAMGHTNMLTATATRDHTKRICDRVMECMHILMGAYMKVGIIFYGVTFAASVYSKFKLISKQFSCTRKVLNRRVELAIF